MRTRGTILVLLLPLLLLPQPTTAHIPIGGAGETLDTATWVDDPTKSWVAYTELDDAGEAQYFRFNITAGTRIDLRLGIPMEAADTSFRPVLVLMGPGLANLSTAPSFLEIPEGAGVMVFDNEPEFSEFEGFTPSSFYLVADKELPAPETATYYVAVYEESNPGRYNLVFGWIEAYTFLDWISIPFNTILVHLWEGQHIGVILTPYAMGCILGLISVFRRDEIRGTKSWKTWLAGVGAALFVGTSFSIAYQALIALIGVPINALIIVTVLVILVSIASFYGTFSILKKFEWEASWKNGLMIIIYGALGLFLWSGYVAGPALLFIAGLGGMASSTSGDKPDVHEIIP
ncbi:MAG: hypothetical protein ACFFD6_09655 [Candidatus Thorarchaeota archaeon]